MRTDCNCFSTYSLSNNKVIKGRYKVMTDYNHMSNDVMEAIGVTREELDKTIKL